MYEGKMKFFIVLWAFGVVAARNIEDSFRTEPQCGVEASTNLLHQNPWLVFFEYYRRGARFDSRCGGSLISKKHVVTAAHCFKRGLSNNLKVIARLGEYDLSSQVDCVDGVCAHLPVKIMVEAITLHPGYDGKDNDIAIITLAQNAPYTETIRPVCLPTGTMEADAILYASGWGENSTKGVYSEIKKNLPLPYWSFHRCQNTYRNIILPKYSICAGGERGIDTCRGDSGGPLVWRKDRAELWGVTSTGNAVCGTKGYPGIYTRVIDHLEWINQVIEEK